MIGVGGAGGNAIDHMIREGVHGVEFIVADTDQLVLRRRLAQRRVKLGQVKFGARDHLEAGRNPEMEERKRISESLKGAHMAFIIAGMGGETGTGSMPMVAEAARGLGILTVAVVTTPFCFASKGINVPATGIAELQKKLIL